MAITLTASYKETLNAATVEKIDELLDEQYSLEDILEFIDEHNEEDLVSFYEEYVRCGEAIGYEAVDALIEEMGSLCCVEDCDERYQGCYNDEADFAEEFYSDLYDLPCAIVVDWQATWDTALRYDFTSCRDNTSYRPVHIFRDC
jgi:hypothetical protein